jgi:hypothetical protein
MRVCYTFKDGLQLYDVTYQDASSRHDAVCYIFKDGIRLVSTIIYLGECIQLGSIPMWWPWLGWVPELMSYSGLILTT